VSRAWRDRWHAALILTLLAIGLIIGGIGGPT